jgi:anti-anti-sigma factor
MQVYHHLGVWKHGDVVVIRFDDDRILDEPTVKQVSDELYGAADRADCHHLVLDFSRVLRLTTAMLGKLLTLRKKMAAKGGRLVLCDLTPEVEEVLTIMKLDTILEIVESEADALKALG